MALERLAKAKALIGLLARGVREAIRPHEDEGFAPAVSTGDHESTLRAASSEHAPATSALAESDLEARASVVPPRPVLVTPPPPRPADPALLAAASAELADPRFSGMCVVADASHVAIAWRAPSERLAAARGLASGPLALRMIAVRAKGEGDVEVDTLELGPAEEEGSCVVVRPASMLRAVASVGLATDARFVSVTHADAA